MICKKCLYKINQNFCLKSKQKNYKKVVISSPENAKKTVAKIWYRKHFVKSSIYYTLYNVQYVIWSERNILLFSKQVLSFNEISWLFFKEFSGHFQIIVFCSYRNGPDIEFNSDGSVKQVELKVIFYCFLYYLYTAKMVHSFQCKSFSFSCNK